MKKILFTVLAAAALVGCTKENSGVTYADNEILASATTLSVDAITKAPVDGYGNTGFIAYVPASDKDGDYTTPYQTEHKWMKFTDDATEVGFVEQNGPTAASKFYPSNVATPIYLCGLYPATGWGTPGTTSTFTFTGKEDVMAAAQVATTKADASSQYKTLKFEHQLTQIRIQFKAVDDAAVEAWGNISGLELLSKDGDKLANVATVTLANGKTAFSGNGGVSFYKMTGENFTDDAFASIALTKTATNVAYVMCAPVTADAATSNSAEYQLKISAEGGAVETVGINLKASGDDGNGADFGEDTAGAAFDVVLEFHGTEIKAIASIAAWEDKGTTVVPVGE